MNKNIIILTVICLMIIFVVSITEFRNSTVTSTINSAKINNVNNATYVDNTIYVLNAPEHSNEDIYGSDYMNKEIVSDNTINESNSNRTIFVSFRIDDITFSKQQKIVLENAVYLAKRYNITFDLGVVAQRYDTIRDNETLSIYDKNKELFEIVAHGFNHANPFDKMSSGEFHDSNHNVSYDVQKQHIILMKNIFKKYNLTLALDILLLPGSDGDNNTLDIASKEGYKLITYAHTLSYLSQFKNMTILKSMIAVPMKQNLTSKDISGYPADILKYKQLGINKIHIVMHPVNFINITDTDKILSRFAEIRRNTTNVEFVFISKTITS